jgi:hypothetical protein
MFTETLKKPLSKSLSYLAPLAEPDMIRIGHPKFDGGYVIPKIAMDKAHGLLSLGINFDWSFDEHWHQLNPNHPIHGYDGTIHPDRMPLDIRESYYNFYKDKVVHYMEMAGGENNRNVVALNTMLDRLNCNQLFIKMDIEGSELLMIEDLVNFSNHITGIAVEFHSLCHKRRDFEYAVKRLQTQYEIVHVHGNNGGTLKCCIDNVPDVIELTFLRKNLCRGVERRKNFYIPELDRSNTQGAYDYEMYLED